MSKTSINRAFNLLNLYKESGVNELAGNVPNDRTKLPTEPNKEIKLSDSNMKKNSSYITDSDIQSISSLNELKQTMSEFKGCELYKSATNMVFSDGNPESKIMLIGEAPGHDEDLQAKPFVGRSGKLLDKMLEAINLSRDKVYIANIVPWRPPSNRKPTEDEIEICLPFIKKHIELINPKALMLLGSTATYALFKNKEGISKIRGKWKNLEINKLLIPTMPTFHPAFLLRQPGQKKYVRTDLNNLRDKIN